MTIVISLMRKLVHVCAFYSSLCRVGVLLQVAQDNLVVCSCLQFLLSSSELAVGPGGPQPDAKHHAAADRRHVSLCRWRWSCSLVQYAACRRPVPHRGSGNTTRESASSGMNTCILPGQNDSSQLHLQLCASRTGRVFMLIHVVRHRSTGPRGTCQ